MRQLVLLLLLTCITSFLHSQSIKPADLVNQSKTNLISIDLLQPLGRTTQELPEEVKDYQLFTLETGAIRYLLQNRQEGISITIPMNDKERFNLQLVEVELPLFTVRTVSNNELVKYQGGKHYRGIIRGDEQSIVSLSVFHDGIMGLISESGNRGNWVLGALEGSDDYIFYNDPQIQNLFNLECGTEDSYQPYDNDILNNQEGIRALSDCVGLYFEVDYDIYLDKGSNNTSVTNYITGLYNQVATLYSNENINTNISEIVIWDVISPYNSTTSIGMLNQFTAYRQGFNGDLAMLLSYQASGGVAYLNGLCSSNPDYSMSFSSIHSTYQSVPTYSWSVMVVAHEFGHLFGSQHTHACVWNGNNTAIDGCYTTEGGCSNPGIPSNGGTIMSYCHLTSAGINLNLGFGPQPGNVIRASVTTANCLQSCGGGGNPPGGCTDNEATLQILLDNYPGETTWSIKNSAGATLYSGGPYSTPASLVTIDICQPDGCYDFVINDSYGDGICCGYGQGYYEIVFNGNILASGGQFGSTETKNFCLYGGNPPTCNDGIQNGDETGVDCGGSSCPACPTCNDGIQNGDETGVDCGGSSCPPCNSGCSGTEVTVQILLDNYPGETTWNLKNSNGVTVVSGGPYNGQSGQTITVVECLSDGCYDFTILDSYGDGICCAYGSGNYNVFSGNITYASGGQFGSVETTNFCLGNNPPTCNDGIQNGDETGVDCGGSSCPACPTCNDGIQNGDETGVDCGGSSCPPCGGGSSTTIAAHYFETGWDNWEDGGSDCYRNNSSSYAYEGNYSIRLRDNSGLASSMTSETFDLTTYNMVTFDFYFYPYSMESGEDFSVQYYDGSSWQTLANYVSGTDFINYSFYNATIILNSSNFNFPSDAQFRIQCDASTNSDRVYIDAIKIEGSTGSPLFENNRTITQLRSNKALVNKDLIHLTPNPATDYISIEIFDEEEKIVSVMAVDVFDMMGTRVLSQRNVDDLEFLRLDLSHLNSGSYILRLNTDEEEVLTKRFQVVQQ
jgi:hypothetical protein